MRKRVKCSCMVRFNALIDIYLHVSFLSLDHPDFSFSNAAKILRTSWSIVSDNFHKHAVLQAD